MPLYIPPVNFQIGSNTSGVSTVINSGTLTLAGGNNITLSQNGNAITIIGGAGGGGGAAVGISNIGNTSGTTGLLTNGSLVLAGGNNVTLSRVTGTGGATITISAGNGGGGVAVGISTDGNTAGSTGLFTNGSVVLVGGNNITLSQSTGPSGATLSIVGGAGGGNTYLSVYEPYPFHNTGTGVISAQSNTSGAMTLFRFNVTSPCLAEYVKMVVSMNFTTGGTSSFRQSGTLDWGIYTNGTGTNASRMSLIGSSSMSYAVTYNNSTITLSHATTTGSSGTYGYGSTTSAGLNITSGYTGLKLFALGLNSTLTQGDYWLGIYHRNSSSSFNSGIRMSFYGNTHKITGLAPMGSFSSQGSTGTRVADNLLGGNWLLAHGSYTLAGMTGLTSDITISQVTQNIGLMPYMKFETRV